MNLRRRSTDFTTQPTVEFLEPEPLPPAPTFVRLECHHGPLVVPWWRIALFVAALEGVCRVVFGR